MKFYDSANEEDLLRVETLLRKGGIEYSFSSPSAQQNIKEIYVAEEDLPKAEELLQAGLKR